ncbi:hypothetical protein ACLQ29_30010 [Micromonospora sp. DT228]|uniref:hypothetical protein n=1 Tax=Micromonospora sp. DT228 TaxID=3393443 RepID=UPI003CF31D29
MSHLLDELPTEVEFATSGTTGPPVTWRRTSRQLVAEAEILAALVRGDGVRAVVTYAPERHLYGYLFHRLVPRMLGVPVIRAAVTAPLLDPAGGLVVAAVPSAWWQIERSLPYLRGAAPITIVHSTATLPDRAGEVLASLSGSRLCELHGSTETGLVGFRGAPGEEWTLADDVTLAMDAGRPGSQAMRVRSPRLARPAGAAVPTEHVLDDDVVITGPRTYRLTGRRHLVKVDGHRLDVARVERDLQARIGARVACRVFRDDLRGEWYEVLVSGGEELRRDAVRALAQLLPAAHRPRAVRSSVSPVSSSARKLDAC